MIQPAMTLLLQLYFSTSLLDHGHPLTHYRYHVTVPLLHTLRIVLDRVSGKANTTNEPNGNSNGGVTYEEVAYEKLVDNSEPAGQQAAYTVMH